MNHWTIEMINNEFLTMLGAVLRQRMWHQFFRLVFAHNVGDLLAALAWSCTVQCRQSILSNNLTPGHKVIAWDLRSTLNTPWLSWDKWLEFTPILPSCVCKVSATRWIIVDNRGHACGRPAHMSTVPWRGFPSPFGAFFCGSGDELSLRALFPLAMVTPWRCILPLPSLRDPPNILAVVVRQLRTPVDQLQTRQTPRTMKMELDMNQKSSVALTMIVQSSDRWEKRWRGKKNIQCGWTLMFGMCWTKYIF